MYRVKRTLQLALQASTTGSSRVRCAAAAVGEYFIYWPVARGVCVWHRASN